MATVTSKPRTSTALTTEFAFSIASSSLTGCAGTTSAPTLPSWRWTWSTWVIRMRLPRSLERTNGTQDIACLPRSYIFMWAYGRM